MDVLEAQMDDEVVDQSPDDGGGADPDPVATTDPAPPEEQDGRRFSPEINRALKAMRDQFPDLAPTLKTLRNAYGERLSIGQVAPGGLRDVQSWKSAIDAAGGLEGIADIQARLNEQDQRQAAIASGDLSSFEKESVSQLAPAFLSRLQQENPQAFDSVVAPHFADRLAATGMDQMIASMQQAAGENPQMQQLIGELNRWYKAGTQGAGQAKQGDPLAGEREKLATQRQQFEQQQQDVVWNGINDQVFKAETDALTAAITPYLKGRNLDDAGKAKLIGLCRIELGQRAKDNAPFQKQMTAYRSSKKPNADAVTTYVKSNISAMADSVAEAIAPLFGGAKAAVAKVAVAEAAPRLQGGAGIAVRVAEKPANLDLRRTTTDQLFARQGWTADGKLVTWPPKVSV